MFIQKKIYFRCNPINANFNFLKKTLMETLTQKIRYFRDMSELLPDIKKSAFFILSKI